jgi:hypothetical protein
LPEKSKEKRKEKGPAAYQEKKKGTSYKTASPFHRPPSVSASNLAELDPELDSLRIINAEDGDGGSADGGPPDKDESHPFEVALPVLPAGIEKANDFAGERISAAQVRPFPEIAPVTTPAAVVGSVDAAMLLGQYMLQMETSGVSSSQVSRHIASGGACPRRVTAGTRPAAHKLETCGVETALAAGTAASGM